MHFLFERVEIHMHAMCRIESGYIDCECAFKYIILLEVFKYSYKNYNNFSFQPKSFQITKLNFFIMIALIYLLLYIFLSPSFSLYIFFVNLFLRYANDTNKSLIKLAHNRSTMKCEPLHAGVKMATQKKVNDTKAISA